MSLPETYGPEPFTFAGHEVKVEFEALPGEAEEWIEDLVRKDNFSMARITVLGAALKKLTVDGQIIYKNVRRGGARMDNGQGRQRLPSPREYFDRDAQKSLTKHLLAEVLKFETWLVEMYPGCFEELVDEDQEPNPTLAP